MPKNNGLCIRWGVVEMNRFLHLRFTHASRANASRNNAKEMGKIRIISWTYHVATGAAHHRHRGDSVWKLKRNNPMPLFSNVSEVCDHSAGNCISMLLNWNALLYARIVCICMHIAHAHSSWVRGKYLWTNKRKHSCNLNRYERMHIHHRRRSTGFLCSYVSL